MLLENNQGYFKVHILFWLAIAHHKERVGGRKSPLDWPNLQGRVAEEVCAAGEQPRVLQGPHSLLVGHSPPQGEGWGPQ